MRIVNFTVAYLHCSQSLSACGGVIVQRINRYVRMRGTSLDGAGVNSNFAHYLWKV
jgi:hypothetical protein